MLSKGANLIASEGGNFFESRFGNFTASSGQKKLLKVEDSSIKEI